MHGIHDPKELAKVGLYAAPFFFEKRAAIRQTNNEAFIREVQETICSVLCITRNALISKTRLQKYVRGRMYFYYICKNYTPLTLAAIARRVGGRDHTTVVHGLRVIPHRIKHEEGCRQEYQQIIKELGLPM